MAWSPVASQKNICSEFSKSVNLNQNKAAVFSPGKDDSVRTRGRERRTFGLHRKVQYNRANMISIPNVPILGAQDSQIPAPREQAFRRNIRRVVKSAEKVLAPGDKPVSPVSAVGSKQYDIEAQRLRIRGNEAFKTGDFKMACIMYSRSIYAVKKCSPNLHVAMGLPLLYCNRAASYLALGKPIEALQDCASGKALDSSCIKCSIRASTCLIRMGHFPEARKELRGLESHEEVRSKLSEIDGSEKKFHTFLKAVGIDQDERCHTILFTDSEAMISAFKSVEAICPHSESLKAAIVLAHIKIGDFSKADKILDNILRENSCNPPLWAGWCRTQTCFFKADYVQCHKNIGSLNDLISPIQPDSETSDLKLLHQIVTIPDKESLISMQKKINEVQILKDQANRLMRLKSYGEAIESYSQALSVKGGLSPAMAAILLSNRAAAHHAATNKALAMADCCRSFSILPNYAKAHSRLATILHELGFFNEALKEMSMAIQTADHLDQKKEYLSRMESMKLAALQGNKPDYSSLLGVSSGVGTGEQMKRAYRKLALKLHPDKAASSVQIDNRLGETGIVLEDIKIKQSIVDRATWLFKLIGEAYAASGTEP